MVAPIDPIEAGLGVRRWNAEELLLPLRLGLLKTVALRDWRSHGYITATVLRAIERSLG